MSSMCNRANCEPLAVPQRASSTVDGVVWATLIDVVQAADSLLVLASLVQQNSAPVQV